MRHCSKQAPAMVDPGLGEEVIALSQSRLYTGEAD